MVNGPVIAIFPLCKFQRRHSVAKLIHRSKQRINRRDGFWHKKLYNLRNYMDMDRLRAVFL